jgi:esterase/lipase superfamily enzyme
MQPRRLLFVLLTIFPVLCLLTSLVWAQKRIALVVGNDRYDNLVADEQLTKAVNDARAVGAVLNELGFQVIVEENMKRQPLINRIEELANGAVSGDIVFFFFAGHGISIDSNTYILPSDAPNVAVGQERQIKPAVINEIDVVEPLLGRGAQAVVVIDACRNYPFRRADGSRRPIGGGCGYNVHTFEPVRSMFSLHSASILETSLERLGVADTSPNTVFTRVLVRTLGKSRGVTFNDLATVVPDEVTRLARSVGHRQHPTVHDGISTLKRDPSVLSGQDLRDTHDRRLMSILFATNRIVRTDDFGHLTNESFTSERNLELTFGSALIRVPENHRLGIIERPWEYTVWDMTFRREERPEDHFVFRGMRTLNRDEFVRLLRADQRSGVLVFVHGYNMTFADAAFRAAQLAWDTQYPGATVLFSWPSRGGILDYDYDRESALLSRMHFLHFLRLLNTDAEVAHIYIVAHSLGSQIVVDALSIAEYAGTKLSLTEAILAAPDVDRDVFISNENGLRHTTKGITLYASSADKALLASKFKAGNVPRAGYVTASGPLVRPGIDTIDVTAIGEDMFALNHGIYASDRSVIDDIGRLLLAGTRPPHVRSVQLRRVPEGSTQPRYWRYPP